MEKKTFLQAYGLLTGGQRRRGLNVVFLLTLQSVLDFFSLASFLPLIFLVINPGKLGTPQITALCQFFGFADPMQFVLAIILVALTLIVAKTQVNIWITFRKSLYAYNVATDLASHALSHYLRSPYTKFAHTDFSREMNRITNSPLAFANNIIIPAGTFLSESFVLSLLLIGIAIYNIKVFAFLLVVILPLAVIYLIKRKNIRELSLQIKKTYPLLLKYTLQIVEALPEIRIFRKETFFKDRFSVAYTELGKTLSKDHTAHTSASRVTELVAALCVSTLIGYAVVNRLPQNETLLLLSIYGGVSFRAIPCVNRIFSAALQMRSNEHVVKELKDIVTPDEDPVREAIAPFPFTKGIEISGITFGYDAQRPILINASLHIRKGEKIALAGKSGTGKTTLIYLLLRLLKEQKGSIRVDGTKLTDRDTQAWRKLVAYVPQNPYILDGTIAENIAFGVPSNTIDLNKVALLIEAMDLRSWVDTLPEKANTVIGERGAKISGGQRQRLAIARALYDDAEILLLDEITNQLDRQTEHEVMRTLDRVAVKKTIILVTHWPELWTSFDAVYTVSGGEFQKITFQTTPATDYVG